ncbi:hypothetical protein K469DRAFT_744491 [Zopfia rhizophila CBS 207.26]|uniref:Spt20-like SEP domain-containing protein n=1 Tax=Zopfia rhizophila CBS 207.26 TaxID=1314779 RepID=A0A6A6EXF5_9PEZI|nr:hypothetical protein K469DRAFT_744491 [Zopfia rhizophila CBS 207.26]
MSASAATARPSQALRQRRESQRPSLARASNTKASTMETGVAHKDDPKRYVRTQQDVLRKFKGSQPSLRVYLHTNHFRINDSQESFNYASPMNELLTHIREKTVPHNMLDEFYAAGVPFYDDCLIVEIHDFRSGGIKPQDNPNNAPDGKKTVPFSIHNYNSFITPSPHVPYPIKSATKQPAQSDGQGKVNPTTETAKDGKETDKENMPAPGQPASQKQPTKAKIYTTVLFPTTQSHYTDIQLLATTPVPDMQTYRRNQAARTASTPTMAHPPTPLTAVPPTPTLPSGRSPKRQKMVVDETNVHEFEAEIYNATCPKLYLEPTRSLEESVVLIETMTHPNNRNPAPARKTRKRTTAELAADEAEAADTQRFMLAGDELQATKTATAAAGDDSQPSMRGTNFQTFSRFKTLEQIKSRHEDLARIKKDEEARQQQAKRQAQAEAEAQKRRELEATRQAEQQNQAMMQHRQEALMRQQQAQQHQQQQEALRAATQAQQITNAPSTQFVQTPQSATQPQHSSPVVRQQTPMAAASSPLVAAHTSHPMGGTPMVTTSSNHGAGSPPRPPSAVSHPPAAMARSVSQQQNQPMSRTGTPQIIQGTPVMNSTIPARNMASTPQPRMNQGSPTGPVPGGTPIMMQTPQPSQNGLTPEQMQLMQRQNQMRMRAAQQQQVIHGGSPGQNNMGNMTPEQLAMLKAKTHIQQQGIPAGQNPQGYQQMLAQQYFRQIHQQQNAQMANMSPQNAGQMRPDMGANAGMNNPGGMNVNNMSSQQLRQHYVQRRQALLNAYGGNPQNIPPNHQQQIRNIEIAIRNAELREAAGQGGGGGGGQIQMNQQGMQGGMNMGGGQTPQNPAQLQQYQQALQQQRARQAQQQQMMMMRQQGGQIPQGMMNNMGMMTGGMQGGMNMNMGNMGNVGGMNMGNMGGMQMSGMTQQQMQQVMLMRQAQMRAGQGRPSGGDGGFDFSGV